MARNKYPEETVNLILDVSTKLFLEKGYDSTSVQDIVNHLGGLSKGAIYHHFESKEDILTAIGNRIGTANASALTKLRDDTSKTGLEKLKALYVESLSGQKEDLFLLLMPDLIKNPRLLAIQLEEIYRTVVPDYVQPILEEGIKDGSIHAEYPAQLAEAVMVLTNIWLNPMIKSISAEEARARCTVFLKLLSGVGIDIWDESIIESYVQYCEARNRASKRNE